MTKFSITIVDHFSITASDHAPLLISINLFNSIGSSPFRFQNMWFKHEKFMDLVKNNWDEPIYPIMDRSSMNVLRQKLKRLKQP